MQQPNTVSRIGAWLLLFGRGSTWFAFIGFFAAFLAGAYATAAVVDRADEIGFAAAGWLLAGLSVLQLIVWALVLLFLARKLGGGEAHTAIGALLLAWLAYYVVGVLPPGLAQSVVAGQLQDRPDLVPSVDVGISLFWSTAVFPLPVWLVAAAHSGRALGLKAIWDYLVERGTGLWLLFVAFQLVSLVLGLGLERLLGGLVETTGDALARQLFEGLRATAIVLFYIMAYREIRAASA
jgi:hypothetical protein